MAASRGTFVGLSIIGFIAIAVGVLMWPDPPTPPPEIPPVERADAYELQGQKKWCEAEKKWQTVLDKVDRDGEFYIEAKRNKNLVSELCSPPKPLVKEVTIPKPPEGQRPKKVSEKDVTEFYPEGRKIRSIAHLAITGKGTNEEWIFKGESHFVYLYRIAVETEVVENRGSAVRFDQRFIEVAQLRADSKQTLEFNLPDSPISDVAWEAIEGAVLNNLPVYILLKKFGEIGNAMDPRGKKLLTELHNLLRQNGVTPFDSDEVEMVAQIEKLSGLHTRSEYVSGLGVTEIKVLDGQKFAPDDLERLAYQSGLLMDYFISRAAEEKSGKPFEVRTQDVGGMLNFGYDVKPKGSIKLQVRSQDADSRSGETVMDVVGGEVVVEGDVEGITHSASLKPISGFVRYKENERFVTEAKIVWKINTHWFTTDHLLFGTKKIRNVKIESFYKASEVVPGEGENSKEAP